MNDYLLDEALNTIENLPNFENILEQYEALLEIADNDDTENLKLKAITNKIKNNLEIVRTQIDLNYRDKQEAINNLYQLTI